MNERRPEEDDELRRDAVLRRGHLGALPPGAATENCSDPISADPIYPFPIITITTTLITIIIIIIIIIIITIHM